MSEESVPSAAYQASLTADGEETTEAVPEGVETIGTRLFLSFADALTQRFGLDHTQVYVGITLIVLISANLFFTSIAWKRYSVTIVRFFDDEKKERVQKEKESKETAKEE